MGDQSTTQNGVDQYKPLIEAAIALRVGYPELYRRVLRGEVPAERRQGRWFVATRDLPVIAKTLGAHAS